jgi:hypothetical protein
MRIIELLNNVTLPITNEEAEVLDMLQDSKQLFRSDLDPRQQRLANSLVNKNVLLRIQENGRITYRHRVR